MHAKVLPRIDAEIHRFTRLATDTITRVEDPNARRLLEQFVRWDITPRLTRGRKPLAASAAYRGSEQVRQAAAFLTWLHDHGIELNECRQTDLDRWKVENPTRWRPTRTFVVWCMNTGRMPKLAAPQQFVRTPAPITQTQRLRLLQRMLSTEDLPLRERVAVILVLLYGQPLTRIVRLTVDDVETGDEIRLRLGDPPSPVPTPFAALLTSLMANRTNMNTATNPNARRLFPGRRTGAHLHASTLGASLRDHGIPVLGARIAALRQLVVQAPAPVVAQALGYHATTALRHADDVGSTWSRYVAGGHSAPACNRRLATEDP